MTVPHVGNYGVNDDDPESKKVWVSGFIVRELSRRYSSHRASEGLDRYLRESGVPGIQGVDTRALVRHIRDKGAMKAVISTDGTSREQLEQQLADWPECPVEDWPRSFPQALCVRRSEQCHWLRGCCGWRCETKHPAFAEGGWPAGGSLSLRFVG